MNLIKRALIRKISVKRGRGRQILEIPPSERLVLTVQFSVYLLIGLVALEIAHLFALRRWNPEIFAAITGLAGTIFGVLLERKV